MKKFCDECGREVDTRIVTKKEFYDVCGERIEVDAKVLVCADCGEEFFCEELDNATLTEAYNIYRRKHKLLLPEEIKAIREQYGLSQRAMARLLNWGDKTIFRYENGSIQDKAHNSMLILLKNPENMKQYLIENEVGLDARHRDKLFNTIDMLQQNGEYQAGKRISDMIFYKTPSEDNGFTEFNYDKVCAMILYFSNRSKELLKTKLMKLLNYSDMLYYKENGVSISGMRYVHLPYGPVPENFDMLLGTVSADNIAHIEIEFDSGYEKHKVVPDVNMQSGVLSDNEIKVLDRIYEKFDGYGSVDISNYSHKENGYISTKQGEIISYRYAKDIHID